MKGLLLLFVLSSPLWLSAGAILLNHPPLFDAPGLWPRLRIYLTTNIAYTAENHPLAELRLPVFNQPPEQLLARVSEAMRGLGWRNIDRQQTVLRAEAVTPLLRFTDDIEARVEPRDGGSVLHLRSASRVGSGDFAANQRHLLDLISELEPISRL